MTQRLCVRKIACILLSVLLIFLLAATVSRKAKEVDPTVTLSTSLSSFGTATALIRVEKEGVTHLLATHEDNALTYTAAAGDLVTLRLAEPLSDGAALRLSFAKDGAFGNDRIAIGIPSEDRLLVRFYLPVGGDYNTYSLSMGCSQITVLSLTHEVTLSSEPAYAFNPIATACAGALLLLLLLTEKKLGFFAFYRDLVKREVAFSKELRGTKRILHLASLLPMLLFFLLVFLDLLLSIVAPFYGRLLAVAAALAVAGLLFYLLVIRKSGRVALPFFLIALILGMLLASTLPMTGAVSWDDEYHFGFVSGPADFLSGGSYSLGERSLLDLFRTPSFLDGADGYAATLLHLSTLPAEPYPLVLPDLPIPLYILLAPFALVYAIFLYAAYLPAAAAYTLGTWVGADIILRITAAKMATNALFALAVSLGIRRLLYGKRMMALCALLPTTVFLSSCFSADPFITAAVYLGFGYFIGELQRRDEPLTLPRAAVMIGALVLGCGPKAIYFILLLPLLFMPRAKFKTPRGARLYRLAVGACMLAVLLSFLVPFLVNTGSVTDTRGGAGVSATEQLAFILRNPFAYADILLRFLGSLFALPSATANVAFYAYLGTATPILGTLFILLLIGTALTDRKSTSSYDVSGSPLYRLLALFTVFAAACFVTTALYIGFTPVGHDTVNGCQFRYFLPLFPLLLYFVAPRASHSVSDGRLATALALGGGAALNLLVLADLYLPRLL